ncbi:MAG: anthranilate synthase component I, partial [Planctomycetota bacterium]
MIQFWPPRGKFDTLARRSGTVPVYCQILSDQLTPVTAFQRLAAATEHAFLLESVIGGEKIARYSFVGANPSAVFEAAQNQTTLTRGGSTITEESADPLERLEQLLGQHRPAHLPEL